MTAASPASYYVGVDLGGTKILSGVFDARLKLLGRVKTPTRAEEGGPAVFGRVIEGVTKAVKEAGIDPARIKGMGLAVPGQVVPNSRVVRYAPNLDWRDFDIGELFPADWSWPVVVENDVRMGTYGEWTMGAAKGAKHVFGMFAGTGVGGGLILNNQLYHGFNGHAGEVGHIVIQWRKLSDLESVAGRRSLTKSLDRAIDAAPKKQRRSWKGINTKAMKSSQLAEFFHKDDPVAAQALDQAARCLGAGVASVVNLLSPEVVVIGGGMAQALGEPFLERIWEVALKAILPRAAENVRCVPALLGDDAGIIGAAAYARTSFSTDPELA